MQLIPHYTFTVIQRLMVQGIRPIIVHPVRNQAIYYTKYTMEKLIQHGALAQLTTGRVVGICGRTIQKFSVRLVMAIRRDQIFTTRHQESHYLIRDYFFRKIEIILCN